MVRRVEKYEKIFFMTAAITIIVKRSINIEEFGLLVLIKMLGKAETIVLKTGRALVKSKFIATTPFTKGTKSPILSPSRTAAKKDKNIGSIKKTGFIFILDKNFFTRIRLERNLI